ncbi:MAG: hypothetical protein ABEJ22_09760 [Haloferacaceae archaeon]
MPTGRREESDERGGWFDRLVPSALAIAALSVEIRAPEAIPLGEPRTFYVVVRNRLPVPVTVSTPTSRLWGWEVDGIREADRRSFSPPETERRVRFAGFERKAFEASWDGRICEESASGTVWTDAPGTHSLTGYVAVENWEDRGLVAETEVRVVEPDGAHQE